MSLGVDAPRAYLPGSGLGEVGLGRIWGCVSPLGLVGGVGVAGVPALGSGVLGFHCSRSRRLRTEGSVTGALIAAVGLEVIEQ